MGECCLVRRGEYIPANAKREQTMSAANKDIRVSSWNTASTNKITDIVWTNTDREKITVTFTLDSSNSGSVSWRVRLLINPIQRTCDLSTVSVWSSEHADDVRQTMQEFTFDGMKFNARLLFSASSITTGVKVTCECEQIKVIRIKI